MQQEQSGSFDMNTNAQENQDKEPSFERQEIQGTPFHKVTDGKKWFITFSDIRVSEVHESKSLITPTEVLQSEMWWIVMRVAGIIQHKVAMESVRLLQDEELNQDK